MHDRGFLKLVRLAGAVVGGYISAASAAVACSLLLPLTPAEATYAGTLIGLIIYPGVIIWTYAVFDIKLMVAGLFIAVLFPASIATGVMVLWA